VMDWLSPTLTTFLMALCVFIQMLSVENLLSRKGWQRLDEKLKSVGYSLKSLLFFISCQLCLLLFIGVFVLLFNGLFVPSDSCNAGNDKLPNNEVNKATSYYVKRDINTLYVGVGQAVGVSQANIDTKQNQGGIEHNSLDGWGDVVPISWVAKCNFYTDSNKRNCNPRERQYYSEKPHLTPEKFYAANALKPQFNIANEIFTSERLYEY
jgi:hypothetical protein